MGTPEGRNFGLGEGSLEGAEADPEQQNMSTDDTVEPTDAPDETEVVPDNEPLGDDFKTRGMHHYMYGDEPPTTQFGNDL